MTNDSRRAGSGSLIERAAEVYDFGAALRGRGGFAPVVEEPRAPAKAGALPVQHEAIGAAAPVATAPAFAGERAGPIASIDRTLLRDTGFIVPEAPVSTLAEEFRLVKRQLLLRAGAQPGERTSKDRMILVCSAQPNEGKTFCAVNLALSLASERDNEVLLVDADVAKPEVLSTLGIAGSAGLIDAIADPHPRGLRRRGLAEPADLGRDARLAQVGQRAAEHDGPAEEVQDDEEFEDEFHAAQSRPGRPAPIAPSPRVAPPANPDVMGLTSQGAVTT